MNFIKNFNILIFFFKLQANINPPANAKIFLILILYFIITIFQIY